MPNQDNIPGTDIDSSNELTFTEKSLKRLAHWIHHNEDHAQSYQQWSDDFHKNGFPQAATLMESAVGLTEQINQIFNEAMHLISASENKH